MVDQVDELKHKVSPITIGLVIVAIGAGMVLGMNYNEITNQGKLSHQLHEFAIDEVGGLRSDMVKEDDHLNQDIEELRSEIKKLRDEIKELRK